ncbi:hypothetical protein GFJ99_11570 [Flavobacterium sp. LMO6]|uniref:Uncharacterized protein n=1 Tax=Flavobacterium phage vB_FspS_laban6-1 TaxID=2686250 RepID=A0A6B9LC41_9CAUD|nr:hypothetical protein [Flavobacterium sp. LMO6]YP_009854800.1 hypothetical protein HWC90_gp02 [Flavobacterium phage vB_FspS_laban6-1]MQP63333.1 hypothetical protein [Flavobacterium sp. LMO6]QHB38973.1 hypothetical protein laban61_gp002 [Flavobacterium phage vB_FspS_laban6-1]
MRKVIHSNFELDLSSKKITDISENPIFSDKFSTKYSYPIEIDLEDDLDIAFGFISFYNSSDPLTLIDVTYVHNDVLSPAVLEVEEIQGKKMQITISWGFEEFPSWNKKLSELPLDKFEVANIYTHAAGIISQTYPAVNYNFPQIHTDKIDTDDEIWFAFEKILNNFKDGAFLENYVDTLEDITYNKNIMQPLPYLLHVLKKGFEDGGYNLEGSFTTHPLVQKICMYTDATYHTTFEQESYTIMQMSEDATISLREIVGTFTIPPTFSWQQPQIITNPTQRVATYTSLTTIIAPGKYRIIGKITLYSLRFLPSSIKIKYRDTIIHSQTIGLFNSRINGIKFEKNIDIVFETLSDLEPNEITIISEQYPTEEKVIFDININPIRLHDMSGEAIPTVLNPNQIDLTRAVPDITFGDFVTTLKNWFNLNLDYDSNNAYLNFTQDDIDLARLKDFNSFEIMEPVRKLQKGNSYVLKFQDVNSKEYSFVPVYHSFDTISNSGYVVNEKTTEIQINGYPLPLAFRNGIQTAHAFEESNDKLQFVIYDGLTSGINIAKDPTQLLLPSVHENFWKKFFNRRINSQPFTWSFLADSFEILGLNIKDKLSCYSNIHLIKTISKTEIEPEIFEVEIETEAEI